MFRTRCVEKDFGKYPLVLYEDNRIARQHRALEEAGLATRLSRPPSTEPCGTPCLEHKEMIAIALTPEGDAEKWPEHHERGGDWDVVVARRELMEVTRRFDDGWRLVNDRARQVEPTGRAPALFNSPRLD